MRFRKSVKVCKGVKLNVSKSGASLTVAPMKGVSFNLGGKGAFLNWSIPGTGVYDRVRLDTLLKDKLGGLFDGAGQQERQEPPQQEPRTSRTRQGAAGSAKKPTSGTAKGKQAGPSDAELERIAHQEALIAIGSLTPAVSPRAMGEMDAQQAEQAVAEWLGEVQAPIEFAVQTEAVPGRRLMMVDLDLPEIENMPADRLAQLADGTLKIKKKTQKELREDYKTCVFGLGQFVAGSVMALVPAAQKVAVSAYTTRRSDKTGEAEDVFIYSVVYEREKMAAVCAQDDPCAACDGLRSRYILLASGLLKPITPYEAEELD
ncbi:MAG: DUF4236 domain-containing protein [Clostridiales bacterium]|nr:DUF4236 domain-containing protein [Clostridiales bacterium]